MWRRLGASAPDLIQRYEDPAEACRLRCPRRDHSQSIPFGKRVPEIFVDETAAAPACCSQRTLSLTEKYIEVGARHRQLYPHGTAAWAEAYARRTAVERFFSYLKLWSAVDWDDIRVHGIAKRALMVVAAVIFVNQRLVDRYRAGQLTADSGSDRGGRPAHPAPGWASGFQADPAAG